MKQIFQLTEQGFVDIVSPCLHVQLYTNNDQTLVNSLHRLLNCEIGGLDCHVVSTGYRTRVHCIHMYRLFRNALVHASYSRVAGQCARTIEYTLV